jgi:hypothetical protein
MLCQFVEKAAILAIAGKLDPSVISLSIFEKTDEFGPGFPHNHNYLMPFHITNMCAADMGVYADRPGDFQVWIDRNLDRLSVRFGDFPADVFESAHGPCNHYPRAFMGAYLKARFHQAVKAARKLGIAVKRYPRHEVTDVKLIGRMARLHIKRPYSEGRTEMVADAVLLATGHWFPDSRQKNYFDSPWPAKKLLERIPPGSKLAIIGTSLRDTIDGTPADDVIAALPGNDVVRGLAGNDLVCLDDGNDRGFGGTGIDTFHGGDGVDRIRGGSARDLLYGEAGGDFLLGGAGNDRMFGAAGDDVLSGGPGAADRAVGGPHLAGDRCFAELEIGCELP